MQIYWYKCGLFINTALVARAKYMQTFSQSEKRLRFGQTLHISGQKFAGEP